MGSWFLKTLGGSAQAAQSALGKSLGTFVPPRKPLTTVEKAFTLGGSAPPREVKPTDDHAHTHTIVDTYDDPQRADGEARITVKHLTTTTGEEQHTVTFKDDNLWVRLEAGPNDEVWKVTVQETASVGARPKVSEFTSNDVLLGRQ